ncbi:hypothetical protein HNY73_004631 [Argiope bruennichi]|uniref:Uncharacterized protein n=1 Tax=Argiope bruennichi TaxID=94029 RepID=A0A8T0FPI4_ARGBR|nr:hypothetical protein HNY73_004631 [Argiope bruennichi]
MDQKWKRHCKTHNVNVRSYPDLSNLVIDPLTEDDSGIFTYNFVFVSVKVPPAWKLMPSDVDAVSGENIVLNCQGTGHLNQ